MFSLVLLFVLLFLAFVLVAMAFIENIFVLVLTTGFVSLISALLYTITDAVDVAFTEAAVGAGVSTALFLLILHLTSSYDFKTEKTSSTKYKLNNYKKIGYGVVFVLFALIFAESLMYAPSFGGLNNPAHNEIYKIYTQESYNTFKVANAVTMVLGSFRGYDTFGETTVILIAALGVFITLRMNDEKTEKPILKDVGALKEMVLTSAYFTIFSFLMLYGFYVQFHGDFGPGGGFQAGVILAGSYVLLVFMYGKAVASKFISDAVLLALLSLGVFIYGGTGLLSLILGGKFLDYYQFGKDFAHSYHYGLFAIEFGVGMSVFAAMALIIGQFYEKYKH
jgi:multicomponent Na+:H+ antiporter subunit B